MRAILIALCSTILILQTLDTSITGVSAAKMNDGNNYRSVVARSKNTRTKTMFHRQTHFHSRQFPRRSSTVALACLLHAHETSSAAVKNKSTVDGAEADVYSIVGQPFGYAVSTPYKITYPKTYDSYGLGVSSPPLGSDVMLQDEWSTGGVYDLVHKLLGMRSPMMLMTSDALDSTAKQNQLNTPQRSVSVQGPAESFPSTNNRSSKPAAKRIRGSKQRQPSASLLERTTTSASSWSNDPNGQTYKGKRTRQLLPVNRSASI